MVNLKIVAVCLLALTLYVATSFQSYSGKHKPPMYGDFEAQRHWMETTVNLPLREWYHNTTENDLLYWGLDYPPLTAYHSFVNGKIAQWIVPEMVELRKSRGIETWQTQLFMRMSVIVSDIIVFIPAVIAFVYAFYEKHSVDTKVRVAAMLLLEPARNLIDHGHFQYNGICLGFTILAVACIVQNRHYLGSVFFCLALNYKQMALYYSVPFFSFLVGHSFKSEKSFFRACVKIFKIGCVVLLTFAICWLPFFTSVNDVLQVVKRIFPFERGLYEDKVANFWCSISPFIKLNNLLERRDIVRLT
jgi:alpha-1,3-glucosyltransferase